MKQDSAEEGSLSHLTWGGCSWAAVIGLSLVCWYYPRSTLWILLLSILLPWLHLGVLLFLTALAWKNRSRAAWGLVAGEGSFLLFAVVPGFLPSPMMRATTSSELSLRVMSWNLECLGNHRKCQLPEDRCDAQGCLEILVEEIQAYQPDVLSLQELTGWQLGRLEEAAGLDCVWSDYYNAAQRSPDRNGLAVCVRRQSGWTLQRAQPLELPPDWTYVFADFRKGDQVFNLMGVHISPLGQDPLLEELGLMLRTPPWRWLQQGYSLRSALLSLYQQQQSISQAARAQERQIASILETVRGFKDPTLIAGDFNAPRNSPIHRMLREVLQDSWEEAGEGLGWTRSLGPLPLRIDYIYASEVFEVRASEASSCQTPAGGSCSDHRAVKTELVWRGEP